MGEKNHPKSSSFTVQSFNKLELTVIIRIITLNCTGDIKQTSANRKGFIMSVTDNELNVFMKQCLSL